MRSSRTERQQLAVQSWPIGRVRPYESNPRLCPASAIEKVAASIRAYGWRQPLVVDSAGVLIAGHTRLLAAKQLGLTCVPVHVASDLSPAAVRAYRLADNRSGEETSWDPERLPSELAALLELDYDLSLLGFAEEELAAFLCGPTVGLCDPDTVPETPVQPISKPGDLWILGGHRLLCGDATKGADVGRVMDGERAALMATDPPYLVDYDGGNHPQTWNKAGRKISSEAKTKHWDSYLDAESSLAFYADFLALAREHALGKRPVIYQWFAMMRAPLIFAAWGQVGLLAHQVIIWRKSRRVLSRCDFMWDYEPALYGWIEGRRPAASRRPPANATALWEVSSAIEDGAGGIHPTMKPVELIRRAIEYHTKPGETIYEPFSGSGTAIIAAEMSGRSCAAIELSPAFVDVAVTRWANFTGREAVRHGQG
jgi:DNA modification methylase